MDEKDQSGAQKIELKFGKVGTQDWVSITQDDAQIFLTKSQALGLMERLRQHFKE